MPVFFISQLGQPTTKFEVRIYSENIDKLPGETLNQRVIYSRGGKYANWIEVDLSSDNIIIEKGNFFVTMVWLTVPLVEERGRNAQFLGAKKGDYPLKTYFKYEANGIWNLPKHRHGLIEILTEDGELLQNP